MKDANTTPLQKLSFNAMLFRWRVDDIDMLFEVDKVDKVVEPFSMFPRLERFSNLDYKRRTI